MKSKMLKAATISNSGNLPSRGRRIMLEQVQTAQPMVVRRRLVIERRIQGELILRISLYCILSSIVTSMMHLIAGHPGNTPEQSIYFSGILLLGVVVTLPLALHDAIRLSHRIVGPIYRLQRVMRRIARAESIAPIRVRQTDFWHDLIQDFNSMLLRVRMVDDDNCQRELDSSDGDGQPLVATGSRRGIR